MTETPDRSTLPFVSVILPVRNEGRFISNTLAAVLEQDYPAARIEVLVVDGMSTDDTRERITETAARYRRSIVLLENPKGIVSTGFNLALKHVRGDVIVRIDGHTVVAADYVRTCVSALGRSGADNVGGCIAPLGLTRFARAVALATTSPFGSGGARFHGSGREEWVDTVYMGAWPRAVFERHGLFDEELVRNQDDEFNYRVLDGGGRILLVPSIRSRYHARSSPWALFRQYAQYGFWKVRVMQKHPRQIRLRQLVPPAFVAALMTSFALAGMADSGRWLLASVVGAYVLVNLASSTWTARRVGLGDALLLMPTFSILHLAWGSGFLAGLIAFIPRRR